MKSLILIVGCAVLAGCAPRTAIDANAVDVPMRSIIERHDTYVMQDGDLADVEKTTFLRSSAIVTDILDAAAGLE